MSNTPICSACRSPINCAARQKCEAAPSPAEDAQAPAAQGVSSLTDARTVLSDLILCVQTWQYDKDCPAKVVAYLHAALASRESVSEPVEQPPKVSLSSLRGMAPNARKIPDSDWGGDAARALTDEQITEISSGYADGVSFCKGQEWAIAFNACAFGLSRRDFFGSGAGGAT